MGRIKVLAHDLLVLADAVVEAYEELYEAGLTPSHSGDGGGNRRGAPLGDPTGEVVVSGEKRRLRRQVKQIASALRRVRPHLERAEDEVRQAFFQTDPEMQEKLLRMRELELELEAEGYQPGPRS